MLLQTINNIRMLHKNYLVPPPTPVTPPKKKRPKSNNKKLVLPTGSHNIPDTKPGDTNMNMKGSSSGDADEFEIATPLLFKGVMKSSTRPSLPTGPLPVFPPPPLPPLPDTPKEEILTEGIESLGEKDHPPAKVPLSCQTFTPEGVFSDFCPQRKLILRQNDGQALWADSYTDGELGLDGNQMLLQHYHRQQIFDTMHPTIVLSASDECSFFHKLDPTGPIAYSTVAHNNFHSLSDVLYHQRRF